jgi:hypothetical protein
VHYFQAFRPFFHGLKDNWLWLIGLCLMAEPLLDSLWEGYRNWADRYVSRKVRTRFSWTIAISCTFIACFLAYADQLQKTETVIGQRDEARRSSSPIQQSTIDRLSADLTVARGQIDNQAKIIERQEVEIAGQNKQITALQPKPERHLSDDDKRRLEVAFAAIKDQFSALQIGAPEGEPQGYAGEFAEEFRSMGIQVPPVMMVFATTAKTAPLQVTLKSFDKVPPKAELFAKAMKTAGFEVVGGKMDTLTNDDAFMFIVGPNR